MDTTPAAHRGPSRHTRTSRALAHTRSAAPNQSRRRQFDGPEPRPCQTCAYFAPLSDGIGECRRFPPQPSRDGTGYYLAQILPTHFCGLWAERPQPGDAIAAETDETAKP